MKKVVIFLVLAMVVVGFCSAQTADDHAKKLVGTWVGEYQGRTLTYVLNANGTGTSSDGAGSGPIFWGVSTSGVLAIKGVMGGEDPFYLSPDGKRMIWDDVVFQKK